MIAHLQFVVAAINNDGGDLLIHENQDDGEKRGTHGNKSGPPGISVEWGDYPTTFLRRKRRRCWCLFVQIIFLGDFKNFFRAISMRTTQRVPYMSKLDDEQSISYFSL